ncbi:AI-2E family transporter, partial [Bacteroidota bacterium]
FSIIILAVLFIFLSFLFFDIIVLLIISIFIAMIFNPVVKFLEDHGISRFLSVLIVFFLSGVVIFFGLSVFIPKILDQMNTLADNITQEKINILLKQIEEDIQNYLPFLDSKEFASKLEEFFSGLLIESVDSLSKIVTSLVSIAAIVVIVPFMTFFILKDKSRIIKGIVNIVPNRYFEFSFWVINQISIQLGRFVRGWIFDAFLVGFMSAVGLTILGIQNSVTIGFVAGVGHLIPYFGPIIGGLPAIIISLIQFGNFSMLPAIVVMFLIIYTLDNGYIQPHIFSKSTDLHPLLIIILILIGSHLLGILGMLLAVPAATVIKTAAKEIYYGYKNYKIIKA